MLLAIPKFTIVLIIIALVLVGATVGLYFLGKRAEKKQAEQQAQIQATAQPVTMLIIDKKQMKITEAGLPEQVIAATPWYAKGSKVPVVKAKVGPKIMTLLCDATIFDEVPVKKEVKAMVSGLYITSVRGIRGRAKAQPEEAPKGLRGWYIKKMKELKRKQ